MITRYRHLKDRIQGKVPKGRKRSSKWRKVRNRYISVFDQCCICGLKTKLEVHHIIPFHVRPELELEWGNLETVCENKKYGINCHLLMGHHGNYRKWNPDFGMDFRKWRLKLGGI